MISTLAAIPDERIITRIYTVRGKKVMLDRDLAELYGVETRTLNQAVRRNSHRFPEDFMLQLRTEEFKNLKSHIVISSWGGVRKPPLAFTEYGVVMLSSVLHSRRAIDVNIQIVKTFTTLREMLATHADLRRKIEEMEQNYDRKFKVVFEAINRLLTEEEKPTRPIGFGRAEHTARGTG